MEWVNSKKFCDVFQNNNYLEKKKFRKKIELKIFLYLFLDSPRNIRKKEDPTLLSINVLSLTLKACYSYLDNKEHRDIEESYSEIENGMNSLTWNSLINHYYSISRLR